MKRTYKKMSFGVLFCCLAVSPVVTTGTGNEVTEAAEVSTAKVMDPIPASTKEIVQSTAEAMASEAMDLYNAMNLKKVGLSIKAFEYALRGYKNLVERGKVIRDQVLSICDFSQSSRKKRFYVIDMASKKVLINTWVAHGRNSGGEYARSFSNNPESHKSSLGFYVTGNTYYGSHGLALKIEGLEKNINDKADARNIVIHGSEYVGANFLARSPINGRSFGCPALPQQETGKVIETIKDGSCLFIYHPTKTYIQKSKVLNG
ncbi:murein L,D-transpeptidase catalytic domain family protein [Niastella vici]|nr:murein L,D-transpeptidase catalytic domain family protein [Niastella vici]